VMEYFRLLGVPDFRVSPLAPQGWGLNEPLFTGEEQFEGMKSIFDHMCDTDCTVIEAEVMQYVNRIMEGRLSRPPLSCWERECQAARTYCALNYRGEVFACGTDMSKHRLGHIDEDFSQSHLNETLKRLQTKDAWFARCDDCEAKRICNYGCPTSAFNDPSSRDAMCRYTKLMYGYMLERMDSVERLHHAIQIKMPGPAYR
jgi:radical SAM protein with 4Fe4S-binding SPASM domain